MTLPRCPLCDTEISILPQNVEGKKDEIDIVSAHYTVKYMDDRHHAVLSI